VLKKGKKAGSHEPAFLLFLRNFAPFSPYPVATKVTTLYFLALPANIFFLDKQHLPLDFSTLLLKICQKNVAIQYIFMKCTAVSKTGTIPKPFGLKGDCPRLLRHMTTLFHRP